MLLGTWHVLLDGLQSQCEEFYVNHLDDIDKLFDKWDHDGSGYIEYNELVAVLENWNNGKAEKTVKQGVCMGEGW